MKKESKSIWGVILKVVIAVSTTLAGIFGLSACTKRRMKSGSFYQNYREGSPPDSSLQSHTL